MELNPSEIPSLPKRDPQSHKGHFGRAIVVGGSIGMTGAISLTGLATLRSGAGLVSIATPHACIPTVASHQPCCMTIPLAEDDSGRVAYKAKSRLREFAESATVFAWGPGMGRSDELERLTKEMVLELTCPMVIDADGINALATNPQCLAKSLAPRLITPHPGEFQRLIGRTIKSREEMEQTAVDFARDQRVVIILKGHQTMVTDGSTIRHNRTGNPGMATAGSGDVLTGVLTGLIAQGMTPLNAALLAVHLHGLAGDLAVQDVGQYALIATDLIDYLPPALLTMERSSG